MKGPAGILAAFVVAGLAIGAPREKPPLRDCARDQGELKGIALEWKPTTEAAAPRVMSIPPGSQLDPSVTTLTVARIEIKPLANALRDPKRIGENQERIKGGCIYPITTKDDAAAWTTEHLRSVFGQLGFEVVQSGGDAVVSGELRKFFVTEQSTYNGEIAVRLDVTSKDGRVVWSGLARGLTARFGSSYKQDNYEETFSDMVVDLAQNLAVDPGFLQAVRPPIPSAAKTQ